MSLGENLLYKFDELCHYNDRLNIDKEQSNFDRINKDKSQNK